jgi:hypothetical protein
MRRTLLLLATLLVSACSSSATSGTGTGSTGSSGGVDAGPDAGGSPTIAITGTVGVHPAALAMIDAGLLAPTLPVLSNEQLFIDEPLLIITEGARTGRLATLNLDSSGTFTAPAVPTDPITIGLVGTLSGLSPDGGFQACEVSDGGGPGYCASYARSASLLYENFKPTADITGAQIFGVPLSMSELLAQKYGQATGAHLLDQGFVLGYVVDAQGQPVVGATFDQHGGSYDVRYPKDDLTPGGTGTNRFGIFLIVAPGQPDATKSFGIAGHAELKCHRVGSSPGTVFSLVYDARRPGIACQ